MIAFLNPKVRLNRLVQALFIALLCFSSCRQARVTNTDLSGRWALIHAEMDGEVYPDEKISGVFVEVTKESFRVYQAEEVTVTLGKFRLEEIFAPKHLDVWVAGGDDAGMKRNGIFQLKGDTLDVCFSAPTAYRPTAFFTRKGDKKILSSWVRVDGPELGR